MNWRVERMIDTLKARTFRVAVVGEFKRKSSLISALLGVLSCLRMSDHAPPQNKRFL